MTDNPDDQPLTRAEFKRMMQEQQQATTRQRQVDLIEKELTKEGMPPGTVEYSLAWVLARDKTNGDLKAAAQLVRDSKQATIDTALGEKQAQAGRFPPQSATSGTAPADPKTVEAPSWEGAREQLEAHLNAQPGEQS